MKDFFNSFKFKLIISVLAMLCGVMLYVSTQGGNQIAPQQSIGGFFAPITKASNFISGKVTENIDILINARSHYNENKKLKSQIGELNDRLIDYEDKKDEIDELRKFIGIKEENLEYTMTPPCRVIARVTNDPYGSFVIDRGSGDGISLYDSVVTGEGFVGIIINLSKSNATVRTILAPNLSVGGICTESRDTGVVEGDVMLAMNKQTAMKYVSLDNTVKVGDLIKSSGESGKFPKNEPIGIVKEIREDNTGLTNYCVLEPVVDISKLDSVVVITSLGEE
jgi:rod shape-determining protein MreC